MSLQHTVDRAAYDALQSLCVPQTTLVLMDRDRRLLREHMSYSIQGLFLAASKNLEVLGRLCAVYNINLTKST